jgi:hypothetical protein
LTVAVGVFAVSDALVRVGGAVVVALLGLIESARVNIGHEPRPKARAAAIAVKGAGQRRITASLLLETVQSPELEILGFFRRALIGRSWFP